MSRRQSRHVQSAQARPGQAVILRAQARLERRRRCGGRWRASAPNIRGEAADEARLLLRASMLQPTAAAEVRRPSEGDALNTKKYGAFPDSTMPDQTPAAGAERWFQEPRRRGTIRHTALPPNEN